MIPIFILGLVEIYFRLSPPAKGAERTLSSILFNYLEAPKPSQKVLVGSSIFAHFIDENFEGYTNLGFDGANALTGLKVLKESKDKPKVIVVEMGLNTLVQCQGVHQDLYQLFEHRRWTLLRRSILHCSRQENNWHSLFRTWIRNASTQKNVRGLVAPRPDWYRRALSEYLDRQIKRVAQGYYTREVVQSWLAQEKQLIDEFISAGVKVILLRCPEALEMRAARKLEYELEEKIFPRDVYMWMDPQADGEAWQTTDGIHLLRDETIRLLARLSNG